MYVYIEKSFPPIPPDPHALPPPPRPTPPTDATPEQTAAFMKQQLHMMRKMMGGVSRDVTKRPVIMQDIVIAGYDDQPFKIRVYRPKEAGSNRRFMLYMHGGGWFGGSLWAVEEYCKAIADGADAVVISPEYHLAPETPFPGGLTDCYKALEYAWDHAAELGIDREKFTVSGDSAGGNYAAALCHMARDNGKVKLESQVLLYPALRMTEKGVASPGGDENEDTSIIIRIYLNGQPECDNPYVSPILGDLKGMPRALVAICEFDGLRNEGREFCQKLDAAGGDARCLMYTNTYHAFIDNVGYMDQAADFIEETIAFLK